MSVPGLVTVESKQAFDETLHALETAIAAKGITTFAKIDHAAGAASAGMELRPTTLLVFGNPKAGTPLMQEAQTAGIDLPLKFLVWQDQERRVWISYNEPAWIAERHGVMAVRPMVEAMRGLLGALAEAAAG